ncbi:hypothetical protein BH20ACI3_BH20ACI3_27030 [soil metagenome]
MSPDNGLFRTIPSVRNRIGALAKPDSGLGISGALVLYQVLPTLKL